MQSKTESAIRLGQSLRLSAKMEKGLGVAGKENIGQPWNAAQQGPFWDLSLFIQNNNNTIVTNWATDF